MTQRVLAILLKELNELRRSRLILTTMIVPTALYVILPIVMLRSGMLTAVGGLGRNELEAIQQSNQNLAGRSTEWHSAIYRRSVPVRASRHQ